MDEIQNNPNVPDDVKAAISGALSITHEEDGLPIEGDVAGTNEEEGLASYDEDFNISDGEQKVKKKKRRHHTDDEDNNDDDGDWLSNRGRRKKKSKKGKRSKKEKKKREKERKKKEKRKTELPSVVDDTGSMHVDTIETPKKGSRKRKVSDIADMSSPNVENGVENIDCIAKTHKPIREKQPKTHKVKIQKVRAKDANILATIESVVNGHDELDDDGPRGGTTIKMEIEMADRVMMSATNQLSDNSDGIYSTTSERATSCNSSANTLTMGKIDNVGLDQCPSLMKLASETTSAKKKKTVTSKAEAHTKRK